MVYRQEEPLVTRAFLSQWERRRSMAKWSFVNATYQA